MSTGLTERVLSVIADQVACPRSRLLPQADLFRDLGVDGADAEELLLRLREEFAIDLRSMRFHRHFGPEGTNLFAILLPGWWRWRHERIPVRIADLVEAARTQTWPIRYSEETSA